MQAIVLTPGRDARLGPLSETTPTALQPLASKPVLGHVLDGAVHAGAEELLIVTNGHGESVRGMFGASHADVPIRYLSQDPSQSVVSTIATAVEGVTEPFACLNGHCFYSPNDLRELFAEGPSLGVSPVTDPDGYDLVTVENGFISDVGQRLARPRSGYANTGAWVFPPAWLDRFGASPSTNGNNAFTDVVQWALEASDMAAVPFRDWMRVDHPWELLEANAALLDGQRSVIDGIVHPNAVITGNVVVESGAEVLSGTVITGPTRIRENSSVGPNAYVRGATLIDRDVRIGHGVEIKHSVIMAGTAIPHLSYVGDSLIGRNVNLGAGTIVANLRHDRDPVKLTVDGERVSTGRTKFGAVIGDEVSTGINTSINPGVSLSAGATTMPGEIVTRDR